MSQTVQETAAQPLPSSSPVRYPNTAIIIPAYNEAANVGSLLREIHEVVPEIPIVIINDGSGDQTAQVAKENGASVISLPYNSGYGVALQTGFIHALQKDYSVVIQMDADRQHDPRSIPQLIKEIQKEDVDVVIGSRFLKDRSYKASWTRKAGILIFSKITSLILGQKVTDPTSGFQAIKGKAIKFMASDFYPPDYPDADFIILLHRFGFKIREIPVVMHPNPENRSMHRGHKTIYYIIKMFLSILATLLRHVPKNHDRSG